MAPITEDHLEQQAIEWFAEIGYSHAFGPELAPDGTQAERAETVCAPATNTAPCDG